MLIFRVLVLFSSHIGLFLLVPTLAKAGYWQSLVTAF